jgi:hypothetical protein
VPLPHQSTGSFSLILTVLFASTFSFRLPLTLLLIGANVNLCCITTYELGFRLVFGLLILVFRGCECKRNHEEFLAADC